MNLRSALFWGSLPVGVSGVILFVMKHLMERTDPFSVVNHPWQPIVHNAHVLAGPILVFVMGAIVVAHTLPALKTGEPKGKVSGWANLLGFALLVGTGYTLQVITEEKSRAVVAWAHIGIGLLFFLFIQVHKWRIRSNAR